MTVGYQTFQSWNKLAMQLSGDGRLWRDYPDQQWLEDFLSLVTLGVREDGKYHVRLRDFKARQADQIAMGKAVELVERQVETAEGRQDLAEVERGQGKGKQREDMDVVVDNATLPGKTLSTPGQTYTRSVLSTRKLAGVRLTRLSCLAAVFRSHLERANGFATNRSRLPLSDTRRSTHVRSPTTSISCLCRIEQEHLFLKTVQTRRPVRHDNSHYPTRTSMPSNIIGVS